MFDVATSITQYGLVLLIGIILLLVILVGDREKV